jgi:hypothetical protein
MTSEVITVSLRRAGTPLSHRVVVRLDQSLDAEALKALAKRTLGITSPAPVGVALGSQTGVSHVHPQRQEPWPRPRPCVLSTAALLSHVAFSARIERRARSAGRSRWWWR